MTFRSVASWIKQEPQEIAIPNIPASKPSTRQKTSSRKGKPSAFVKAGIHLFIINCLLSTLTMWTKSAFLDMSSVILFLVPSIRHQARTTDWNAKYDKNGTSKFCTIKWAKETEIYFEHEKRLKIYEARKKIY